MSNIGKFISSLGQGIWRLSGSMPASLMVATVLQQRFGFPLIVTATALVLCHQLYEKTVYRQDDE